MSKSEQCDCQRARASAFPFATSSSGQVFCDSPDLLPRFVRGEAEALALVYRAFLVPVSRIVERCLIAGGAGVNKRAAEVDDLVQTVFMRAFSPRALAAYDPGRDYGPYLAAITRHAVADWFRSRQRDEIPTDLDALDTRAALEAEGTVDAREPVAIVDEVVAQLPGELRGVHQERFVLAKSQEQAARALSISRQTLRTREQRLRTRVLKALRAAGFDDWAACGSA